MSKPATSVLVLGGGPDAEREVSVKSATAIAGFLRESGRFDVRLEIVGTPTVAELKAMPGDVVFPYLHGPWGEGGPLQDLLELDGRPYVGARPGPARAAMDKVATKVVALSMGIPTPPSFVLSLRDPVCPLQFPVVIKPVHEGSTVGLHVCGSPEEFRAAIEAIRGERARGIDRVYMIEPRIGGGWGRELTVGVIDDKALPIIEIEPKAGLYDYEAKYTRDDTRYTVNPALPADLAQRVSNNAVQLGRRLGCRHISRADFMLDPQTNVPWLLEINTTPGFTDHSLVPKAARAAGMTLPGLCASLVDMALRDAAGGGGAAGPGGSPPAPPTRR
jgi:D-alanine-D-alanine ligase